MAARGSMDAPLLPMDFDPPTEGKDCPFDSSTCLPARGESLNFHSASSHQSSSTASEHSSCPVVFTQEIDPRLIKASIEDRAAYLTDFLAFTSRDAEVIQALAPTVNAIIPAMVDDMYAKLFEFDITKKIFMTRNNGFNGPLPNKLEDLTLDSAQIVFRKVFMKAWARRVLTTDYSSGKTWAYMDKVGIMHTGVSPFKHQRTMGIAPLNVPYRDCALLLGWVQMTITRAIMQLPEESASTQTKLDGVAAITKVIWIQNDLFARHYINE